MTTILSPETARVLDAACTAVFQEIQTQEIALADPASPWRTEREATRKVLGEIFASCSALVAVYDTQGGETAGGIEPVPAGVSPASAQRQPSSAHPAQ